MKHHCPRLLFLLAVLCLAVCLLAAAPRGPPQPTRMLSLPTIVTAVTTTRPSTT